MPNVSPKFRFLILFILFFGSTLGSTSAQVIRCATMEMDSALRANNPSFETHQQFENWMQNEIMAQQSMFQVNGCLQHGQHPGPDCNHATNEKKLLRKVQRRAVRFFKKAKTTTRSYPAPPPV